MTAVVRVAWCGQVDPHPGHGWPDYCGVPLRTELQDELGAPDMWCAGITAPPRPPRVEPMVGLARLVEALASCTGNLDEWVGQRAGKLAAQRVAEVELEAAARVAVFEQAFARERERHADLEREFRRQMRAADQRDERYRRLLVEAGRNPRTGLPS